jgi:hypothetical protein
MTFGFLREWAGRLAAIGPRSTHRIPPWVFGVALGASVFFYFVPLWSVDWYMVYGPVGRGELFIEGFLPRNPRFAHWLFWLFSRLPWKWDYLALMLVSSLALAAAVYWGGGAYWKAFLSFPFGWLLASGQIDAFTSAGFALSWWALQKRRYWLMGAGLAFATMLKPQIGLPAVLCIWLWAENKWKPLAIPLALTILSLIQFGVDWPIRWASASLGQIGILEADWANASLFQWIGAWSLLAWVPALLVPMTRLERLRAVMAATALSLPYYPAYQLLNLLVFPASIIEWALTALPLAGGLGFAATAAMPLLVIARPVWMWASNPQAERQFLARPQNPQ